LELRRGHSTIRGRSPYNEQPVRQRLSSLQKMAVELRDGSTRVAAIIIDLRDRRSFSLIASVCLFCIVNLRRVIKPQNTRCILRTVIFSCGVFWWIAFVCTNCTLSLRCVLQPQTLDAYCTRFFWWYLSVAATVVTARCQYMKCLCSKQYRYWSKHLSSERFAYICHFHYTICIWVIREAVAWSPGAAPVEAYKHTSICSCIYWLGLWIPWLRRHLMHILILNMIFL